MAAVLIAAAVAACATPEVDRTASFNQAKYDLT